MSYLENIGVLVSPGDLVAEGDYKGGRNTYQEGTKIYSSHVGLVNHVGKNVYVVALKGSYMPFIGDLVIGKIIDMRMSGWTVDINSPYTATLFASDALGRSFNLRRDNMTDFLDMGDLILAKISSFDRTKDPSLTIKENGLGKVTQGHITEILPTKIPRVIGRKGSMITMLKRETGCQITIGQNGLILVSGQKPELESLAIQAIHTIEKDAHTDGLTDRICEFIGNEKKRLVSHVE
ncbi:MAG: exosome complex RNA-binding protein Rrp4 [Candidatus Bathyarchaeota archaeon]